MTLEDQPLVSVLMPSYNSEQFIGTAIQSVLDSTYRNLELIVTDDNSTDNTYKLAQSFAEKDDRVKVYLNDKNYGDYPNRNISASYAIGKYLKYVDHDDFIYPYGLEQMVYYMEQFPEAGYGLCSLDQDNNQVYPFQLSPEEAYKRNYFYSSLFHKAPLSSIISREAFETVKGFTGAPFLGDFEFWHIMSQHYPVVLMPHGFVWYRFHENQESKKMFGKPSREFEYLTVGEKMVKSVHCPLNKSDKKKVLDQYRNRKVRFFFSTFKHHSLAKALEIRKKGDITWGDLIFFLSKKIF